MSVKKVYLNHLLNLAIKEEPKCCKIVSYFIAAKIHNELIAPDDEVELEKWTEELW